MKDLIAFLRGKGLRPTTHRVAVARFVFNTSSHPSADEVLNSVRRHCPTISRATVYNALDLFVKKGLLRKRLLKPGAEVFDPLMDAHHHFIDETTGAIFDVPLDACKIQPTAALGEEAGYGPRKRTRRFLRCLKVEPLQHRLDQILGHPRAELLVVPTGGVGHIHVRPTPIVVDGPPHSR